MAPSRLTSIDLHNRHSVDGGSHQQRSERSHQSAQRDRTNERQLSRTDQRGEIAPTTVSASHRHAKPGSHRQESERLHLRQLGDLLIEIRRRDDAVVKVTEVEALVGRVRVLVGQADTEEHARETELLLER